MTIRCTQCFTWSWTIWRGDNVAESASKLESASKRTIWNLTSKISPRSQSSRIGRKNCVNYFYDRANNTENGTKKSKRLKTTTYIPRQCKRRTRGHVYGSFHPWDSCAWMDKTSRSASAPACSPSRSCRSHYENKIIFENGTMNFCGVRRDIEYIR